MSRKNEEIKARILCLIYVRMILQILAYSKDLMKILLTLLDDKSIRNVTSTCKILYKNATLVYLKETYRTRALKTPWLFKSLYCDATNIIISLSPKNKDYELLQITRSYDKYDLIQEMTLASFDSYIKALPKELVKLIIPHYIGTYRDQMFMMNLLKTAHKLKQIVFPTSMEGAQFIKKYYDVYDVSFIKLIVSKVKNYDLPEFF